MKSYPPVAAVGGHFPGLPATPKPTGGRVPDRLDDLCPQPPRPRGQPSTRRKHPELYIGGHIGPWRITRIIGRGHRGRSDLRVAAVCDACGRSTEVYEYQLRAEHVCRAGDA